MFISNKIWNFNNFFAQKASRFLLEYFHGAGSDKVHDISVAFAKMAGEIY